VHCQGSFQEGEDFHSDSLQGGEQVPDGVLQPTQVQHGRAEAAKEAEDQETHPMIDLAGCTIEKPRFKKTYLHLVNLFMTYLQKST